MLHHAWCTFGAGVSTSNVTPESVTAYTPSPPPAPAPTPGPDANSGSSAPIGAIVGGAVGGVAALAAALGVFFYLRRRRRREPSTPKLLANMESGHLGSLNGKKGLGMCIADLILREEFLPACNAHR